MDIKLFERVSYDPEADACYITINTKKVTETLESEQDCWVDVAEDGSVIGIEVLNASRHYDLINNILLSRTPVEECVSF